MQDVRADDDMLTLVPPHSMEAEQAVLGGLVLDNETWDLISGVITADDFYNHWNKRMFQLIEELANAGKPFDVITLSEQANKRNLKDGDFFPYVADVCANIPSTANIAAYRDIVRERSTLRSLITLGHECTRLAQAPDASSVLVLDELERKLLRMAEKNTSHSQSLRETLMEVVEDLQIRAEDPSSLMGVNTGLTDLNKATGGLQDSDLIVLAARPSMGKTSLALLFLLTAIESLSSDKTAQFYSLEMPAKQLVQRLIAMLAKINLHKLRAADLDEHEWSLVSIAMAKLKGLEGRLIIDDEAALTPAQLRSRARLNARKHGKPGIILVDYLQLMRSSKAKVENRNLEIAEISASLKALAKEMNCPVVALSQLNRGVESRPNKRPNNGDLRESGAIEQDADMILFIYRDEVYNPETEDKGIAEIIISKNRNGPTSYVRTAFIGEKTLFADLAPEHFMEHAS